MCLGLLVVDDERVQRGTIDLLMVEFSSQNMAIPPEGMIPKS